MRRGILLLALVVLAACAKKKPKNNPQDTPIAIAQAARAAHPSGIEALIPADSGAVVRFASLERARKVEAFIDRLSGRSSGAVDKALRHRLDASKIDESRPFYIALHFGEEVSLTFVAAAGPDAARAAGRIASRGGYTVFADSAELKEGPCPLIEDLLEADLSMCIDLSRVVEAYAEEIDAWFQETGDKMAFIPSLDAMLEMGKSLVRDSRRLDLAVSVDGGNVDFQFVYERTNREKAPASRLAEIVARLPDHAFLFAGDVDHEFINRLMMPLAERSAEALPEEKREAFRTQTRRTAELSKLLQGEFAMALDIGAQGVRVVLGFRTTDAQAYIDGYAEMMSESRGLGWALSDSGTRTVAGVTVRRLMGRFDLAEAAGDSLPPPMRMMLASFSGDVVVELAEQDGVVWMVMDKQGAHLADVLDGGRDNKLSPVLAPAVERMGDELRLLLFIDARNLVAGISHFAKMGPKIDYGRPLPITIYGGGNGTTYRGGATSNIEELTSFFKSLNPLAPSGR